MDGYRVENVKNILQLILLYFTSAKRFALRGKYRKLSVR